MLEHHIQKAIIFSLMLTESARFSELKPDALENKLFDYHLKKVISEKFVIKLEDGSYALSPKGRRIGKDAIKKQDFLIDRAHSVLFLVVKRQTDGAWLMCRRKTHPLLDKVGFMHTFPSLIDPAPITAQQALNQKAGLNGSFTVRGSGYLRMFESGLMESFTHFTLLECRDGTGTLIQSDDLAEYYWDASPDFTAPDVLPSIPYYIQELKNDGLFYFEQNFTTE